MSEEVEADLPYCVECDNDLEFCACDDVDPYEDRKWTEGK